VANTLYISVLERRREIGLRRALGANRGQIRGQFLTESAALSGLGAVAGTLIGFAATIGYCSYPGWPVVVPVPALVGGLLGAVLVGMAGAYPSVRASRLTPTWITRPPDSLNPEGTPKIKGPPPRCPQLDTAADHVRRGKRAVPKP